MPAGDLAEGVRRDLAVLGRQVGGELLAVRLDEVPDLEQDVGPLRQRRRPPGRERRLGRGDGGADLIDRGEVDLAGDPPGRRVVDRARAGRTLPRRSGRRSSGGPRRRGSVPLGLRLRPGRCPARRPASSRSTCPSVAPAGHGRHPSRPYRQPGPRRATPTATPPVGSPHRRGAATRSLTPATGFVRSRANACKRLHPPRGEHR